MSDKSIIYARFSPRPRTKHTKTGIKAEEGETIDHQIEVCNRYCKMRNLSVVNIIQDEFQSARQVPLFKRKNGSKLRKLPSGVKHIVAARLDRLFRSVRDGLAMLDVWKKQKVHVHLADQGGNSLDLSTATGRLFVTMQLGFSEYEAGISSERTSAMVQHQIRNGRSTGPNLPYGKMHDPEDDSRMIDCPEELDLINEVRSVRAGGWTYQQIIEVMTREGKFMRGSKWTLNMLNKICTRDY